MSNTKIRNFLKRLTRQQLYELSKKYKIKGRAKLDKKSLFSAVLPFVINDYNTHRNLDSIVSLVNGKKDCLRSKPNGDAKARCERHGKVVQRLSRSFAKSKKEGGDIVDKTGASFISVQNQSKESPRQIKSSSNLKTTMEIPVFLPPDSDYAQSITEDALTGNIPEEYQDTRIVLQIKDPHWAHTYWEVSKQEIKKLRDEVGIFEFAHSTFALRLHDVTRGVSSEIRLPENTRDWYLYLENDKTLYQVELGLQSPTEGYTFVALSNLVQSPPDKLSCYCGDDDIIKEVEDTDRLAGHEFIKQDIPKDDSDPTTEEREEQLQSKNCSDACALRTISASETGFNSCSNKRNSVCLSSKKLVDNSHAISSRFFDNNNTNENASSVFLRHKKTIEDNSLNIEATFEVVIYGKISQGCQLLFCGDRIEVEPDGSFSFRVRVPCGTNNVVLTAYNPETKQFKTIEKKLILTD